MSCHEIEALRLGLMNVLGVDDDEAKRHAENELGEALEGGGPVEALADAGTFSELRRHLDTAVVELEDEVARADPSEEDYDYLRARLLAVKSAERELGRIDRGANAFLDDLGEKHGDLHEIFS